MPQPPLPHPPLPERAARGLLGAPIVALVLYGAFGVSLSQLAGKAIRPLSARGGRALGRWSYGAWTRGLTGLTHRLYGVELVLSGAPLPAVRDAVLIANHQSMLDIPVIVDLAEAAGRGPALRWFAKDVLKYVPGVGWALRDVAVMVKREWARDQRTIEQVFAGLMDSPDPFWVVSFSEGTRITPEKLAASQAFSEERGMRPLQHLLRPRPKGFAATVSGLRPRLQEVIDLTLGYPEGVPDLEHLATGQARRFHVHLRRYPIEDLPAEEEALGAWLQARFEEKDALLDHFYREGRFPSA
ncbi:MAG: acyltransferase [Deltaproteobacteria bacterium]|nr:acyltransferase [Deltaproteobacteria bacterium]